MWGIWPGGHIHAPEITATEREIDTPNIVTLPAGRYLADTGRPGAQQLPVQSLVLGGGRRILLVYY